MHSTLLPSTANLLALTVGRHLLRKEGNGELADFWRAMRVLYDTGWQPSEYTNLLQFAYQSTKWHDRYDWQIVGDYSHPILSQASHYRGLGCKAPLPGTLQQGNPATRALETETALFYPTARSPVNSDKNMRNWHVDGYPAYSQLRSSDEWRKYLRDRQEALQTYAKQRDYRVSVRDTCGQRTTDAWSKCFNDMRDPSVSPCDWCANAPILEVPGIDHS